MELSEYISRQKEWSIETFGNSKRTEGIIKHITSEFDEIRNDPSDPIEWIDIAILAMDGAWRTGATPEDIENLFINKQEKNFSRSWGPILPEDQPTYHKKE